MVKPSTDNRKSVGSIPTYPTSIWKSLKTLNYYLVKPVLVVGNMTEEESVLIVRELVKF